jgi:hypothetical protein
MPTPVPMNANTNASKHQCQQTPMPANTNANTNEHQCQQTPTPTPVIANTNASECHCQCQQTPNQCQQTPMPVNTNTNSNKYQDNKQCARQTNGGDDNAGMTTNSGATDLASNMRQQGHFIFCFSHFILFYFY